MQQGRQCEESHNRRGQGPPGLSCRPGRSSTHAARRIPGSLFLRCRNNRRPIGRLRGGVFTAPGNSSVEASHDQQVSNPDGNGALHFPHARSAAAGAADGKRTAGPFLVRLRHLEFDPADRGAQVPKMPTVAQPSKAVKMPALCRASRATSASSGVLNVAMVRSSLPGRVLLSAMTPLYPPFVRPGNWATAEALTWAGCQGAKKTAD